MVDTITWVDGDGLCALIMGPPLSGKSTLGSKLLKGRFRQYDETTKFMDPPYANFYDTVYLFDEPPYNFELISFSKKYEYFDINDLKNNLKIFFNGKIKNKYLQTIILFKNSPKHFKFHELFLFT